MKFDVVESGVTLDVAGKESKIVFLRPEHDVTPENPLLRDLLENIRPFGNALSHQHFTQEKLAEVWATKPEGVNRLYFVHKRDVLRTTDGESLTVVPSPHIGLSSKMAIIAHPARAR